MVKNDSSRMFFVLTVRWKDMPVRTASNDPFYKEVSSVSGGKYLTYDQYSLLRWYFLTLSQLQLRRRENRALL